MEDSCSIQIQSSVQNGSENVQENEKNWKLFHVPPPPSYYEIGAGHTNIQPINYFPHYSTSLLPSIESIPRIIVIVHNTLFLRFFYNLSKKCKIKCFFI
jgi:hypothetical protein